MYISNTYGCSYPNANAAKYPHSKSTRRSEPYFNLLHPYFVSTLFSTLRFVSMRYF